MAGSKVLKPVAGVVILVGLYAAAGYIGVPAGVRWAVSNVVPDALGGRDATVGDVSFNPWNWSLEINDLAIKSAHAPKNNLLTLKHLSADLSGSTLTEMAPIVESITVDGFNMHLTANEANNKEAKEAVEKAPADASTSSGLPAFSLANVRVTNSSVRLTNAQNGADVKITDIDFALPILSTLPSSSKASINPKLSLKVDGTPINAEGTLKGETATMAVKIDKLNVAKLLKAAPVTLPVAVEKASASCDLHVSFDMPKSGVSGIKVSGSASVADVDVRELSKQPFVRVKSASIDIKGVDVSAQKADITNIKIVEPSIKASIASQAKSSVQKTQTSAQTATTSSGGSWKWSVGSAHVSNGSVQITDTSLKPAATLTATSINLDAKGFASDKGKTGTYTASANVAQGKLSSSGKLSVLPLAVNATTDVKSLHFATFNPWIKSLAGAQLTKGTADVKGKIDLKSDKTLSLKWAGDLAVTDLEAKDAKGKTLMTWTQATATGVDVKSISPVHVSLKNLTVKEPAKKTTQTVSKAAGLLGAIAALTGHENTARRAQKAAEVVTSDISISNVEYKDGKFMLTEKSKNALSTLVLESLNSVFGTDKSKR
jgi:hypothetical protein